MENIEQLLEQLSNLTVPELVKLTRTLEDKWGIKALPVISNTSQVVTVENKVEQTEFSIYLIGINDGAKMGVIKMVRELTGIGLKESKDLVEAASPATPKDIKKDISKDEANDIKAKLETAGGKVEIK